MAEVEDVEDTDTTDSPTVTLDPVPFNASSVFGDRNENKDTLFKNLESAITSGNVAKKTVTVEFAVKKDGSVSKVFQRNVTQAVAKNMNGALALPNIAGDQNAIWEALSEYGFRNTKQNVYVSLKNAAAGPEKAIEKAMKALSGLTSDELELAKAAFAEAGIKI